ncbi:DUF5693 family protein [Virgibacillus salexigens]|uniref:Uncharacterized protein n=1 Tax=Virgibacillus kapii TaxID=1638645 RepID=A0ABQ2DBG6_9BACI|nr:DUF5693 family protein [Virgibacillus kapii]GGJ52191.1 hypothetical protein GCM10007111_12920 [Virgibacillus kapii]
MNKQKWIWMTLIVLLAVTIPGIIERWQTETENNTYEIAAPYQEIDQLATDHEELNTEDILSSLKKSGLNTVSISPLSLNWMENQDIITIYNEQELNDALRFSNQDEMVDTEAKGYYITQPRDAYFNKLISENLQPSSVTISGQDFYFIEKEMDILSRNIAYNEETLDQVKQLGLNYMLRVENTNQKWNQKSVDQLIKLKETDTTNLLFYGQDVIGYPNMEEVEQWTNQLTDVGYHFYSIEFTQQKGLQTIARNTDYNTIRLHSMDLNNKTLPENIDQAVRAVKERNIRSIFFHIQAGDPTESLENANAFVEGVHHNLENNFQQGSPKPFTEINTPIWTQVLLFLAGILFTGLAATIVRDRKWMIAAIVFMTLLVIGYYLTERLFLIQGFALILAIVAPIYAVLSTINTGDKQLGGITLHYLKALGITFVGIIIVIGLLNGNAFITGFEVFRGVKLVYLIPILFVGVFLFWREIVMLLKVPVKYWHLAVIFIIGVIGIYYITRTGNSATVSDMELMIRSTLEEWLYVRPRTKEFLIGLPFYLLAIYVFKTNKLLGKVLVIPGIIGFLSIMNTFTHLHIPLHISLLRTGYSIVIGYLLGLLLIWIYRKCVPFITKRIRREWV